MMYNSVRRLIWTSSGGNDVNTHWNTFSNTSYLLETKRTQETVVFYIPKLNFMLIEIKTSHSLYITMSYHPYDDRQKAT